MSSADLVIIVALGAGAVFMGFLAVRMRNLMRAVGAYALSSAFLAALFFLLDSPYAGALELTVGAGLVAVLFLVALVLSGAEGTVPPRSGVKDASGAVLAVIFLLLFVAAVLPAVLLWPASPPVVTGIGTSIWVYRTTDVLLQGIIILGGVIAILLLLGSRKSQEEVR
jgi:NADH:ubiquinone oxidoreductase subunit 6 (subunit J)